MMDKRLADAVRGGNKELMRICMVTGLEYGTAKKMTLRELGDWLALWDELHQDNLSHF